MPRYNSLAIGALVAAAGGNSANSFVPGLAKPSRFTPPARTVSRNDHHVVMNASRGALEDTADKLGKSLATFLLTFAATAQISFASPEVLTEAPVQNEGPSSTVVLSVGAPSFGGGGSFDTLDFSMPSYDGAAAAAPKGGLSIPELKFPGNDSKEEEKAPAAVETKADAATEKAKEAAEKAAKEKEQKVKEADEKAKKEADEEAKAVAKAKRLADQKAKQEEAVKRAADKAAADAKAAVDEVSSKVELPKLETPKIQAPPQVAPKVEAPKFEAPKFDAPKFDAPKFDAPKFEAPKFDAPKFDAPKFDAPKFEAPKFDAPKFEAPKFDAPKFEAPKIAAPKLPTESAYDDPDLEPQEVRDGKATAARAVFKGFDQEAKELETVANAARSKADAAKKEAGIAKAEACKTRPGGKILCLRPFGIGY